MKKNYFLLVVLLIQLPALSQVSFGKKIALSDEYIQFEKKRVNELFNKLQNEKWFIADSKNKILSNDTLISRLKGDIIKIVDAYEQKRLSILSNDTLKYKADLVEKLIHVRDSLLSEKKEMIKLVKYWKRYEKAEEAKQIHNFFPVYYGKQAVRFFEGDSVHQKLFQNNLVNFNPGTKKMILYTEAINDYFGPFRACIGFQIKNDAKVDSLSTADSTQNQEKKVDMLSSIQNGGGDISLNLKYPIKKSSSNNSGLQYMLYVYANSGFSLPVLNKASDDFLFNYDAGAELFLYIKGFNDKITFYSQIKGAFYNGNKNYKKVILDADQNDPTRFFMVQSSFGLDFMDGYRLRVDLFNGNSFVRKNFPASITFVIRPGK